MAKKKILIIDYDQNSLVTLQGVLAKEGYEVVTAGDGQAGWDKYNKESPDLVLMEAMLPKVHGFELCQRITSERNSQATVFIMTGVYKDRVYRTEALRTYGASEYFEKPLKMAELMSSIEAVLGKPQPQSEPEPEPVRVIRPEAVLVEPRKRERSRPDEELFALPADLDQLARDIPKARKPAPARREPDAEARFESLADELLKSVVAEPVPAPKKPVEKSNGGNGNGHETADIDKFLKSALAGLDLEKDKVKVPAPKPAPPSPPPAPPVEKAAPPVEKPAPEKPAAAKPAVERPLVEKPVHEKPKPAAPPVPEFGFSMAEPAKNTLTPGDPGSDISPFFTPGKPKPEAPREAPKVRPLTPPAAPAAPAKAFKPAEKPKPEPARPQPPKPEPAKSEPVRHEPVRTEPFKSEVKIPEISPTPSGDIFQHRDIFAHVGEEKTKKGFPKLVGVAIGVAAVAVAAFLLLRPKPAPKPAEDLRATQGVTPSEVPAPPVVTEPPVEVKKEPVKPKPKPAAQKTNPEPAYAEGILPSVSPSATLPLTSDKANGTDEGAQNAAEGAAGAPPVKTEEAPPAKTEAEPPAGAAAEPAKTVDPGITVSTPAAPPAKEGDLVDLGSVTSPPTLVKRVNPVYPQVAQQLGVEGSITVNALIDEKGNVIDTGILKGIQDDKGLGKAAETALRKWRFEPARKDGVAVKVWKSFVISFKAEKTGPGASE